MKKKLSQTAVLLLFATILMQPLAAGAQGTAFTYNGRLDDGGSPASGIYDLRFAIYDALTGGTQQGVLVTNAATAVSNGLFTVTLDFGAGIFNGASRWLELGVRTNGGGAFGLLTPRQAVTPTPYAIYSANAASAGTAASATTATTANNFSGALAGDVTGTQGATVVATVGGQPAANVASGATAANAATNVNMPGTLVTRDGSGNFSAGTITANLAGNAATATTATNVTGNLADTQLSTNIARLNGTNTFIGTNNFSGVVLATNENNVLTGTFTGNGLSLTNLNPANLSAGTAGVSISGNAATATTATNFSGALSGDVTGTQGATVVSANMPRLNGTNIFTGTNTFAGVVVATNQGNVLIGTFTGNGAGLTSLNASNLSSGTVPLAQLPVLVLTNNETGVTLSGTFTGNGSSLTNLNPANLSAGTAGINISGNAATASTATNFSGPLSGDVTGTQGATVVSANLPRLNATNIFTGTNTFAGVVLATNQGNVLTGTFTGNGAGLTSLNASNLSSGTIPLAQLSVLVLTNNETGVALSGTFTGNGFSLTNLNPANLSAGTAGINISGNAATASTATNFSGPLSGDVTGTQGATVVSANLPRLNATNIFTG